LNRKVQSGNSQKAILRRKLAIFSKKSVNYCAKSD